MGKCQRAHGIARCLTDLPAYHSSVRFRPWHDIAIFIHAEFGPVENDLTGTFDQHYSAVPLPNDRGHALSFRRKMHLIKDRITVTRSGIRNFGFLQPEQQCPLSSAPHHDKATFLGFELSRGIHSGVDNHPVKRFPFMLAGNAMFQLLPARATPVCQFARFSHPNNSHLILGERPRFVGANYRG